MHYQVRFVADGSLPDGIEWAFARTLGKTYLFVTQSAIDVTTGQCEALSSALAAWQRSLESDARSGLVELEELARAM